MAISDRSIFAKLVQSAQKEVKRKKKAPRKPQLAVALVGMVPSGGSELLQQILNTSCSFYSFPKFHADKTLLKKLPGMDVVVAQYFTEPMAKAAVRLRLLHAMGAGLDSFCLPALSPRTTVANVFYHGPAIAEYVMMMVLALGRNLTALESAIHQGDWRGGWIGGEPPADEIRGKTLGLIGFGHIGREIAVRAQAFGMEIRVLSAHPPARKPQGIKSWSGSGGLRALLQDSDFVVLACPLNEATRGLIGVEELKRMKRDACLINIARGPIVDESALYHALKRRQIRAAAIDVWYRYPKERERQMPSKFPFHELQNVIMTPHASGWTNQTFGQRFRLIAENIDRLASGRTLLNVVQGPKRAGQLGSR